MSQPLAGLIKKKNGKANIKYYGEKRPELQIRLNECTSVQ